MRDTPNWVAAVALATSLGLYGPVPALSQDDETEESVRVVNAHTNVHAGPATYRPVLVLAPKDTVLNVVGRQGEWLEVELSAELRQTGMVMRWYYDEERGWVHQSQVEPVEEDR